MNTWREFGSLLTLRNILYTEMVATTRRYHGTMTERQELKERLRQYLPKKKQVSKRGNFTKTLDVVVTTYSYFSSEKSDDRSFLRKFEWDYVSGQISDYTLS